MCGVDHADVVTLVVGIKNAPEVITWYQVIHYHVTLQMESAGQKIFFISYERTKMGRLDEVNQI